MSRRRRTPYLYFMPRMRGEWMSRHKRKDRLFLAFCLVPSFICFLIFTVYPLVDGLYMSFFKWSGISGNKVFQGIKNYVRLFKDPVVPRTILNDYFLVAVKVVFIMALAMAFAVVLTQFRIREAPFYRFVYFFPNVMPVVTTSILWVFIYSSKMGLINAFLEAVGKEEWARSWLGTKATALPALAVPLIWAGIGLFMLMLMGAIGNIPSSLYEAASLDGAGKWEQFIKITVPLIWPQIKTSIIYIIITTLNGSYVLVQLTTQGGPNNATQVMGSYLYQQAFDNFNFGYGAAIGVMILVLNLVTVLITQVLLKKEKVVF